MYCSKCGSEIREGHRYCVQCGERVVQGGDLQPTSAPEPYRQPASQTGQTSSAYPKISQPAAGTYSVPEAGTYPAPEVQTARKLSKGARGTIIAVAAFGALCAVVALSVGLAGGFSVVSEPVAEEASYPTDWTSHEFAEYGFTISFPHAPAKEDSEENVLGVGMPSVRYECAREEGRYSAMVVECDTEQVDVASDSRGVFYRYINALAEDGGYSIEEWHNATELAGHPCASAVYHSADDVEAFRIFVTSSENRLYVLRGENASPSDFEFFTRSLSLYDPTGVASPQGSEELAGDTPDAAASADEQAGTDSDLEMRSILSDRVGMLLPKTFTVMSEEMARIKYPMESRPTLICTNESGSVNIAFSLPDSTLTSDRIPQLKDYLVKEMEGAHPSAEWLGTGTEEVNGRTIGYIEVITPGLDTDIYNLIWFTDMDGKTLMCTFNCTEGEMDEWKPIAQDIKNSFRVHI